MPNLTNMQLETTGDIKFSPVSNGFQFEEFTVEMEDIKVATFIISVWSYYKETARSKSSPALADIWQDALGTFGVELVPDNFYDYAIEIFDDDTENVCVEISAHFFKGLVRMPAFRITGDWPTLTTFIARNFKILPPALIGIIKCIDFEKDFEPVYDAVEIGYDSSQEGVERFFNKRLDIDSPDTVVGVRNQQLKIKLDRFGDILFTSQNGDIWMPTVNHDEISQVCRFLYSTEEFKLKKEQLQDKMKRPNLANWWVITKS